eukprot:Awhi_evm1s2904
MYSSSVISLLILFFLAIGSNALSHCNYLYSSSCNSMSNLKKEAKTSVDNVNAKNEEINDIKSSLEWRSDCLKRMSWVSSQEDWESFSDNAAENWKVEDYKLKREVCKINFYRKENFKADTYLAALDSLKDSIESKRLALWTARDQANTLYSQAQTTVSALVPRLQGNKCYKCKNGGSITGIEDFLGLSDIVTITNALAPAVSKAVTIAAEAIAKFVTNRCFLISLAFPVAGMGMDALIATTPPLNTIAASLQANPACNTILDANWALQTPSMTITLATLGPYIASVLCYAADHVKQLDPLCTLAYAGTTFAVAVVNGLCGRGGSALMAVLQPVVMCHLRMEGNNCGDELNYPCELFRAETYDTPASRRRSIGLGQQQQQQTKKYMTAARKLDQDMIAQFDSSPEMKGFIARMKDHFENN